MFCMYVLSGSQLGARENVSALVFRSYLDTKGSRYLDDQIGCRLQHHTPRVYDVM